MDTPTLTRHQNGNRVMTDSKQFYDKLRGNKTPPKNGQEPPPGVPPPSGDTPSWVLRELARKINEFAAMAANSGRNAQLNNLACEFGRLPIPEPQLRSTLLEACRTNGLLAEDGLRQCNDTIDSGLTKARQDGPKTTYIEAPSHVEEIDAADLAPENDDDDEKRDLHALAVSRRAYELRINDEARALWTHQQAQTLGQQAPDPVTLTDFLNVEDEDATYRIKDLLPTGGRALLVAQQKAGKTSLIANLIRALADGGHFLERFSCDQVGAVTLLDTELDERMLRRWLRDQDIRNTDNVKVISLKGKIATFNIQEPSTRAQWANKLRGSDFVILDCLRPCLDVLGLSEDKDAGKFLVAWDALMSEVGNAESVVVHHMGHAAERSRGDSRLIDWPDVNWRIIKESQSEDADMEEIGGDGGMRFFTAHGRDVNVPEFTMVWDDKSRTIKYREGGRRRAKKERQERQNKYENDAVISILSKFPGLTKNKLVEKMQEEHIGEDRAGKAIQAAVANGTVHTEPGKNRSQLHYVQGDQWCQPSGGGGGVPPIGGLPVTTHSGVDE